MNKYKCSLGVTALLKPVVWISISVYAFCVCFSEGNALSYGGLGFAVLTLVLLLDRPTSVSVDDDALTVAYPCAPFRIYFSDVISIKKVEHARSEFISKPAFYWGRYAALNFGYQGRRYNKSVGFMEWHCSQLKNFVVIEVKNSKDKMVVTPDDREGFLADIEQRYPHLVSKETL